ncbi:MAG: AsmA family protein [Rubrivivax sp.]|nr:AsmA family protein [Rubrivivax sp.]
MSKPLKITLGAIGGVLLLLVAVVAFIAATFDPNAYKPLLAETVQKRTQRTLAIPGPISLSLFPNIGVKLGEVSLSERGGKERFAAIESARVSLALWPLLRGRVVADRVEVAGLRARVVRTRDGKLSIDDLLGGDAAAAAPAASAPQPSDGRSAIALDVAGVAVTDAEVSFDDRRAPRRVQLSKLSLETGRIAPGRSTPVSLATRLDTDAPKLGADIAIKGNLQLGPAPGRIVFDALDAVIDAKLDGTPLKAKLEGGVTAELEGKGKLEAKLGGEFDGAPFKVALTMPRLTPAAYTFDAEFEHLNVDHFRGGGAAPSGGGGPEKPLDLSALRDLEANGNLRIGALQVMNLKLAQVRAGLRASGGRVLLNPLAANLYEGKLAGSASVTATAVPARVGLQQTLEGIAIGPLLKDFTGNDAVRGRGTVTLDVSTAGATVGAMMKALGGHAKLELKDGAVRGVNLAQILRVAKAAREAARGGKAALTSGSTAASLGTAARGEATDFSDLTATLRIAGGVARNDDLAARSPLLRIGGAGDIDLGNNRLDYTVRATVVDTLQGQGGAELQELRGQTVPVKLSGPFDAIQWRIDFGSLLKEAAEAQLDRKREQLKEDARRRLGDKLQDLLRK